MLAYKLLKFKDVVLESAALLHVHDGLHELMLRGDAEVLIHGVEGFVVCGALGDDVVRCACSGSPKEGKHVRRVGDAGELSAFCQELLELAPGGAALVGATAIDPVRGGCEEVHELADGAECGFVTGGRRGGYCRLGPGSRGRGVGKRCGTAGAGDLTGSSHLRRDMTRVVSAETVCARAGQWCWVRCVKAVEARYFRVRGLQLQFQMVLLRV